MQDLVIVHSKNAKARIVMVAVGIFALLFCWFAVRWQLGNMFAGLTDSAAPNSADIADMAQSWAPADPAASWLGATTLDDAAALQKFEQTVRLAPFDLRWRVELGRAYEQADRIAEAEAEFRKATELAPSYSFPRWHLGNFYLRQGREDDALAQLKISAENNQDYRDQVYSLVWEFFNKDAAKVEGMAGERPEAKARLAYFFAGRGRAVDALRNWNSLTDAEKASNADTAKAIAHGLFLQRYFPQSLEFARQFGIDDDALPEKVTNGSFEKGIGDEKDARFGWQLIRNDPKFEVATDGKVKRDGDRSLKITFRTYIKPALSNLFQTVVVEPKKGYRLSFWLRTESLKSGGGPLIQIINANDDKLIAQTPPFPTGTNDWQQLSLEFTSPENCSGITIRTTRAYCGEECPITGVLWYDEFVLSRL